MFPLPNCYSEGCVFCSPKNLNASFNLGLSLVEILRSVQDDNLSPSAHVIEHICLHAIERIGGVVKSPRRELHLNQAQKRIALGFIGETNRHALFVVRRVRRGGAKFAHAQPSQSR